MSRFRTICRCCFSDLVPGRSLIVALVVGAILNLVNQGDALFAGGRLNFTKLILTFAVPYCVATYGAVSLRLSLPRKAELAEGARTLYQQEPSFWGTKRGR